MTISTAKARNHFSDIINRAAYGKERVVLTRRGKQLAALVPIEDIKLLQTLEDQRDLKVAREALKEAKKKGTIPWDKLKAELGL